MDVVADEKSLNFGRRDSLVKQASIERVRNEGLKRCDTIRRRQEFAKSTHLAKQLISCLSYDAISVLKNSHDEQPLCVSVVITQQSAFSFLCFLYNLS